MVKEIIQVQAVSEIDEETPDSETGIAEHDPVVLLVSTVKANRALIKQARAEIQQSRELIRKRTAWKDFIKKHFNF